MATDIDSPGNATPPETTSPEGIQARFSAYDIDAECVREVLKGKRERFNELIERYQHAVFAVTQGYIRDKHAAEDVAQDAFIQAFTALPQLRDPKLFFPWLIQITRHRASRMMLSGKARALEVPLSEHEVRTVQPEPADARMNLVLSRVEQLPEPYRQTVLLKYQRDLSCKEIAKQEGVAVGTITSRLTRALVMLRKAMGEET